MRASLLKEFTILAGVTVACGAALIGCESKSTVSSWQANGTPVHMDSDEPWWNYKLIYHPNAGVYFEPYSHTWHWQENGEWRSSTQRPEPVTWRPTEAIIVKLNWDTPEYGHHTVAMLHPQTKRGAWDRTRPITVAPTANEETALTSVTESSSESDSIALGPTPNKSAPTPAPGSSSEPSAEPSSEPAVAEASSSEATPVDPSAVAGATGSDQPE